MHAIILLYDTKWCGTKFIEKRKIKLYTLHKMEKEEYKEEKYIKITKNRFVFRPCS